MYYLYSVSSEITRQYGQHKIGCTRCPPMRLRQYHTGTAPVPLLRHGYDGVWRVSAQTPLELLRMERRVHTHFATSRQERTEWFELPFQTIRDFIVSQEFCVDELSAQEVETIHVESSREKPPHPLYPEEDYLFQQKECAGRRKEEFFETFLPPGIKPRRIQEEVWDEFERISVRDQHYRGIVQWPTGAGKTLALLALLVLSAHACADRGQLFRGLLVIPKNDIMDTLLTHIRKLSHWGITVCEGHRARLSFLTIPTDRPALIIATHASLTEPDMWDRLPPMTHLHYDEVHRITGHEFLGQLTRKLEEWKTQFLTGTSATPLTSATIQRNKMDDLFQGRILHRCEMEEAVREGWIAQPRFGIHVISGDAKDRMTAFLRVLHEAILEKRSRPHQWKCGKVIVYLPTRQDVRTAVEECLSNLPLDWLVYSAVEGVCCPDDKAFVRDAADAQPRLLFACEKYREGSDIYGIEMTVVMMGNSISANVFLQCAGRALRKDYEGKEGWCLLVRCAEDGMTEEQIWDQVVMDIVGCSMTKDPLNTREKIHTVMQHFSGNLTIHGKRCDLEETISRIQSLYARRAFEAPKTLEEKYTDLVQQNHTRGFCRPSEYLSSHPEVSDPRNYFRAMWISWYHFLGVDTTSFPNTKHDWMVLCKNAGILSWEDYKKHCRDSETLPPDPACMYTDYTNWEDEMV